jgi:hypothetical protein
VKKGKKFAFPPFSYTQERVGSATRRIKNKIKFKKNVRIKSPEKRKA